MDSLDVEDDATVFRDVILLALLGFMVIVVLLLPHLNPPTVAAEAAPPPGNVVVEVRWPDQVDADVDLWVEAPGDKPVGYSNKGGQIFNLLRDDLGFTRDLTGLNYEVAFSRGIPAGAYTVNLHLYRNNSGVAPVTAQVSIGLKKDPEAPLVAIAQESVDLTHVGQEYTVLRLSLDDNGKLVPGSLHYLPRALRSSKS